MKINLMKILDLTIYLACIIACLEILIFIFLGSAFGWIMLLKEFPHLEAQILSVFKQVKYYIIVIVIGLVYYNAKNIIEIVKDIRKRRKNNV